MGRFCAFLLAFVLGSPAALQAQPVSPWAALADPVFMRIDMRGLPHPSAYAVAQDSTGFVWIGTLNGLARYDGYRFQNFLPNSNDPKALPEGWIRELISDPAGALWIGTSSSGLVRFDQTSQTFRTWRPRQSGNKGPRSANVVALNRSEDGRIWVGGDGGLDRFDPKSDTFEHFDLEAHGQTQPRVEALLTDRSGAVWVASLRGVYVRTKGAKAFVRSGLASAAYCLYEDDAGRLWVGGTNQVTVFDPQRRRVATFSSSGDPSTLADGEQWAIAQTGPSTVLIGTEDTGLSIVDLSTKSVRRVQIDAPSASGETPGPVWQLFRDRSGLLWIASGSGGLEAYDARSRGIYNLAATDTYLQLTNAGVQAVIGDPHGRLWIGGTEGQLTLLDPRTGATKHYVLPNHLLVNALTLVTDDTLWIGTSDGLCTLAIGQQKIVCPSGPAAFAGQRMGSAVSVDGTLWVETQNGGLVGVRDGKITARFGAGSGPNGLSDGTLTAIAADREHRVWAGTDNGINLVDPKTRRVQHFLSEADNANALGTGEIVSILEDRKGEVWVGSMDGPVNRLNKRNGTYAIRRMDAVNGVPFQNITNLAQDAQHRIWASTTNSLVVFDPKANSAGLLGWADGIPDTFYTPGAADQLPDGTIVFGGRHGLTVVTPSALPKSRDAAPPLMASLKIGGRATSTWGLNAGLGTVELPAARRDISVEFAALEYPASQSVRYAYKLDGYDNGWIDADPEYRVASYTNLPPGQYTLRARATNKLGQWSPREFALAVRADYAWYETWWARLLAAILIVVGAYAFYKIRTTVLRGQQRELEAVVAKRTQELAWANEQLSQANVRLEEMSVTEPLTGLRNRRFLIQHVEADVAVSLRRYEDWLAGGAGAPAPQAADLLFFIADIDHFKLVNDRFGHHAGDMVLTQMRERFLEVFRESDFVVRWGGEEFLAVARGSRREDAPEIAERVREAIASRQFAVDDKGERIDMTASIGFAAFPFVRTAPRAVSWSQTIDVADRALYLAKEAGRNACIGLVAAPNAQSDDDVEIVRPAGLTASS
ncbi:MAG TPA: two-component regulator propeller domain-containing protein [Candidatus Baltobacteraceae bacterium]